jgi:hypothetical protein
MRLQWDLIVLAQKCSKLEVFPGLLLLFLNCLLFTVFLDPESECNQLLDLFDWLSLGFVDLSCEQLAFLLGSGCLLVDLLTNFVNCVLLVFGNSATNLSEFLRGS